MTGTGADAPGWIVCRGAARLVTDGQVVCPLPALVGWEHCMDCHLLADVEGDRDRGCSDAEPQPQPELHRG